MFKGGSVEDELMRSMEKELVSKQLDNKHGFDKLAKAIDYLNAAADIFENAGLHKEAEEITNILEIMSSDDWEDQIEGGLADKKSPKDFDKAQLEKGISVEMEHTKDKHIATEIAMDHLTEDPNYYKKLEKMEAGES